MKLFVGLAVFVWLLTNDRRQLATETVPRTVSRRTHRGSDWRSPLSCWLRAGSFLVAAVFTAIAMVVLGGTRLSGGSGGVGLTVVGVLTLGYLQKVLSLNAFSSEVRLMLTGVILVVALLFQRRYRDASET